MIALWRVDVFRPEEDGGPFYQEFKGADAAFYAARMANKWRGRTPKKQTSERKLHEHQG